MQLPTGTVSFLMTDVEGSTRLWARNRQAMGRALARHEDLVRSAIEANRGHVFSMAGDSFAAAFATGRGAISAAIGAQLALAAEDWGDTPIRVRMAVGTGEAEERDGNYYGPILNETSRLMEAAWGGQVLVSKATLAVVGDELPFDAGLLDMEDVFLADVDRVVPAVQLTHPRLRATFPPLRAEGRIRGNLRNQMTSFVGREAELEALERAVRSSRLVTLTGIGGSGKTRLAMEFAARSWASFPDGVWTVDLSSLDDGSVVAEAVAAAIGVAQVPGRPTADGLVEWLDGRATLLLLDNCEPHLEDASRLAADVVARAGRLRILATSRQRLGVRGEHVLPVFPLDLPAEDAGTPDVVCTSSAVQLFIDRAEAVQPGFVVSFANANDVGNICRKLEGLPLAIELAAARLNILDVRGLLERLDDRFALLKDASPGRPTRHRTLAATIDWSYELLSPAEQAMLAALSVFVGGFTLDAAEEVCVDGIEVGEVLDLVAGLVDKSLVTTVRAGEHRRFRLLETVREYAAARLAASGKEEEIARKHVEFFRRMVAEYSARLWEPGEDRWLNRLEDEWPNLRRTIFWHLQEGETGDGMMMAGSLRTFYSRRYHITEARTLLRALVDADETPGRERARALHALVNLSPADHSHSTEAIELCRRYESEPELIACLNNLGAGAKERGHWQQARELLSEALDLSRESEDRLGVCVVLENLADLAMADGDGPLAVELAEEAVAAAQEWGSLEKTSEAMRVVGRARRVAGDLDGANEALRLAQRVASELGERQQRAGETEKHLAAVALDLGDVEAAIDHLRGYASVTAAARRDRGLWEFVAAPLIEWARVASAVGRAEMAVTLLAAEQASRAHPRDFGLFPPLLAEFDQVLGSARAELEDRAFDDAWARGLEMSTAEALDHALETLG